MDETPFLLKLQASLSNVRRCALNGDLTKALAHLDDATEIIVGKCAKDKAASSYSDPPHLRTGLGGCTSGLCAA